MSFVESFLVACAVVDSDGINLHGIFKSENEARVVVVLFTVRESLFISIGEKLGDKDVVILRGLSGFGFGGDVLFPADDFDFGEVESLAASGNEDGDSVDLCGGGGDVKDSSFVESRCEWGRFFF